MADPLLNRLTAENERLRQHIAELERLDAERLQAIRELEAGQELNESLRESEQRFKNLSEAAFEAIAVSDGEKLLQVNKRFLEMYGYEPEDVPRLKVRDFIAPECWELVQSKRERGVEAPYEFLAVDSRGRTFPAEASGKAIPYQGRMVRVTAIRDISERKQAEKILQRAHEELERRVEQRTQELASANQALRQSEEKWRSLVTTAPDFILILDRNSVIQFINRVQYPTTPEQIIGAHADDFVIPEYRETSRACIEHVLTTGDYTDCELVVQELDGNRAWYHIRYGALRQDNQIVAVTAIGTDITQRKQTEEKLQAEDQLLRKLLELQEQERRLVAYELHDGLIQDLVGAQMMLEAARNGSDTSAGSVRDKLATVDSLLQKAIHEGRRMIGDLRPLIIDELGTVASIEYLISEERKQTAAPIAFVHDVGFTRLAPLLEGTIFRIVQESLTNIRRHSRARHGYVSLQQLNGDLRLEVRDDGIGFDPQAVSKERFGLRGIRERARLFGGAARIESAPGKGTRVTVTVPMTLPVESATNAP